MFNLDLDYLFLNLLLLGVFAYSGKKISAGSKYKGYAFICIALYTFVLGSRYMRGNDYEHYIEVYVYGYGIGTIQPLFTGFNDLLKENGVQALHIFYYYSLPFIIAGFIFLSRFKKYAKYMLPFFLIDVIYFNEFQIRQSLGYTFVFLFLYELFRTEYITVNRLSSYRKYIMCYLYIMLAYSVHTADAYIMAIILVVYLAKKTMIPLVISIPAYLIGTFVISRLSDITFLQSFMAGFEDSETLFSRYVENSDKWFSAEGYKDIYTRNPIVRIFEVAGNISLFILSYKYIKKCCNERWIICLTNLFIIGAIVKASFINLEIMNRLGGNLKIFVFAPLSVVLFYRKQLKRTFWTKVCFLCLTFWIYDYLRYLFLRGDMTKFIWDIMLY